MKLHSIWKQGPEARQWVEILIGYLLPKNTEHSVTSDKFKLPFGVQQGQKL